MKKQKFSSIYLLCIFIIIQPLIDILPLYENSQYQLFGFTIPTLIRCIFILIFGILTIKKITKKEIKYLVIYITFLIIYTIIHHFVTSSNMVVPDNYTYSLSQELFYIIRMMFPFIIILFIQKNELKYEKFINTILLSSIIISVIIIVGNTLCISYASYGSGQTNVNWLHWFTDSLSNYTFDEMTSKGWFYMANQVSGIMVLLLPFDIYDLIINKRKMNIIATSLTILSMIMLGTRTSSYGWLAIIIIIIIIYLYLKNRKKLPILEDKKIYPLVIIMLIGLIFLSVSPITRRVYKYQIGDASKFELRPPIDGNKEAVYDYIEKVYPTLLIKDTYILDVYNYKYDPQFWYDTFDLVLEDGPIDNRVNQLLISKRIMELNDYKLKYQLFGYSFSRMRSAELYTEHDIIVQTFTMGLLGLIMLIGPYIIILIFSGSKIIKNMKNNNSFMNTIFIMTLCIIISVSIITSHILDELFVTIYLGFICGYFLNNIIKEGKNEEN